MTVLATDVGGAKRARDIARLLDTPLAVVDKERIGNEERISSMTLIGDVEGRDVIIPDDEILTGGTIVAAARIALRARRAQRDRRLRAPDPLRTARSRRSAAATSSRSWW